MAAFLPILTAFRLYLEGVGESERQEAVFQLGQYTARSLFGRPGLVIVGTVGPERAR
jgi:hypothetical protein